MIDPQAIQDTSNEIADEVLDAFSKLHPHLRMNRGEWHDLHEMIEREVYGHFNPNEPDVCAYDLVERRERKCGSPQPS